MNLIQYNNKQFSSIDPKLKLYQDFIDKYYPESLRNIIKIDEAISNSKDNYWDECGFDDFGFGWYDDLKFDIESNSTQHAKYELKCLSNFIDDGCKDLSKLGNTSSYTNNISISSKYPWQASIIYLDYQSNCDIAINFTTKKLYGRQYNPISHTPLPMSIISDLNKFIIRYYTNEYNTYLDMYKRDGVTEYIPYLTKRYKMLVSVINKYIK